MVRVFDDEVPRRSGMGEEFEDLRIGHGEKKVRQPRADGKREPAGALGSAPARPPAHPQVAVSVKRDSRMTVILIVLGYCSSSSIRLRSVLASSRARSSDTICGATTTRISRPA